MREAKTKIFELFATKRSRGDFKEANMKKVYNVYMQVFLITPKISYLVILLTVGLKIPMMLVQGIWYLINL